jgi:hypothetical protein
VLLVLCWCCCCCCAAAAAVLLLLQVQGLSLLDELVFLHKPSSTVILTDLAFNFPPEPQKQQQQQSLPAGQKTKAHDEPESHQQQETLSVSGPIQLYLRFAGGDRRCCLTKPFKFLISDAGEAWGERDV